MTAYVIHSKMYMDIFFIVFLKSLWVFERHFTNCIGLVNTSTDRKGGITLIWLHVSFTSGI